MNVVIHRLNYPPTSEASVPLGKLLSSSKRARRPIGLTRNISNTGRLSTNSTTLASMPSFVYSCCNQKNKISAVDYQRMNWSHFFRKYFIKLDKLAE